MKVFVDLCTSLGGASAAFDNHPDWVTIKIDNAEYLLEHHRGMILHDVTDVEGTLAIINMRLAELGFSHDDTLVVWASPPCDEFSTANVYRDRENPNLEVLLSCKEIIERLDTNYWIIENVAGAKDIFTDELERAPTQIIGPVYLWGHFPLIALQDNANYRHRKWDAKGSRILRSHNRALIPYPLSEGLRASIDCQRTLF